MTENEKLLELSKKVSPCPFCGKSISIQKVCSKKRYYIECAECELTFGKLIGIDVKFSSVEDLINAWESRVSNDR